MKWKLGELGKQAHNCLHPLAQPMANYEFVSTLRSIIDIHNPIVYPYDLFICSEGTPEDLVAHMIISYKWVVGGRPAPALHLFLGYCYNIVIINFILNFIVDAGDGMSSEKVILHWRRHIQL